MYSPGRQLPTWSQPMARGSTAARLLGVLLVGFVCATCMALYYLSSSHSEIHILHNELIHGASHHTQAQQIAEMHLTKLQEQVLSGETALKAADKACKGRLAAVEAELVKVRRIATEATEEGERLADIAARASKEQAIADAHTLEAKDSLAACAAELAAARNASSSRPDPGTPSLPAAWAAARNVSAGAADAAQGPGSPADVPAPRNASDAGGDAASGAPDPEEPSGLAALAAGAAASAAETAREGVDAAGGALQDARQAAARAAAKASDGAVGAAAGMASRSSEIAAVLSHALRQTGGGATTHDGNASSSGGAVAHDEHETGPGLERAGSSQEL